MDTLFIIGYLAFYTWVVFFGGADRVVGTWLAAFEFPYMDKAIHIKVYATVTLFLLFGLFSTTE
jgi:hypothetical protein